MMTNEDKALAQRFVKGELQGQIYSDFEARLKNDQELQKYVSFLERVVESTRTYGKDRDRQQELMAAYKKRQKRSRLIWLASLFLLVLSIAAIYKLVCKSENVSQVYEVSEVVDSVSNTVDTSSQSPSSNKEDKTPAQDRAGEKDNIDQKIEVEKDAQPGRYALNVTGEYKRIDFLDDDIDSRSNFMGADDFKWITPPTDTTFVGELEFRWEGQIKGALQLRVFTYHTQDKEYVVSLQSSPTLLRANFAPDLYYWEVGLPNEQAQRRGRFRVD